MKKIMTYPIVISHENEAPNIPSYLVYIPDLDGYTEGYSLSDAINMAIDYVSLAATEDKLPESNFVLPTAKKNQFVTQIKIDLSKNRKK
ncbi:MAG: hypothetical protein ABF695_12230 [Liquorilactobacillus ghanensis]|uniref:hypothetical protein n=1 Tax=Liquorilactobacillus ghanensis TaxID=399370 RepID=UPI0039EB846C